MSPRTAGGLPADLRLLEVAVLPLVRKGGLRSLHAGVRCSGARLSLSCGCFRSRPNMVHYCSHPLPEPAQTQSPGSRDGSTGLWVDCFWLGRARLAKMSPVQSHEHMESNAYFLLSHSLMCLAASCVAFARMQISSCCSPVTLYCAPSGWVALP